MPDLPIGTITFLFTDIQGSTELVKTLRERYGDVLAEHQRIVRAAIEQARGQELDTQGDAFFVAFRRAADAVEAALLAQRALDAHPWPDGVAVKVRMGLHTAEPAVGADRYVGIGVHRAARICAAGHGGQVLLSSATRELVQDELPDAASLRDLGEHRLKDLDRPEHLYQLLAPGLADEFPPLRTLDGRPVTATPFSGREGELASAAEAAVGRRRPRRTWLVLAALLLAVALAVGGVLLLGGNSSEPLSTAPANAVAVIDPETNALVDAVPVSDSPGPMVFGGGRIWVLNRNSLTVSTLDPKRRVKLTELGVASEAGFVQGLAYSAGGVVVATDSSEAIAWYGVPAPNVSIAVAPEGRILGSGTSLAASGDDVWVTVVDPPSLVGLTVRIPQFTIFARILLPDRPTALALTNGFVWVGTVGGSVIRIDPVTEAKRATDVGARVRALAAGADGVWAATTDGVVVHVHRDLSESAPVRVGSEPVAAAVGAGAVWVANGGDGTVTRVDPAENRVVATIPVGPRIDGVAVGGGHVWAAVRSRGES